MAGRVFAKVGVVKRILAVLLLTASLAPTRLLANDDGGNDSSLLGFLSAQGSERFDADRPTRRPARGEAIADLLYTHSHKKLRLLGEFEVANDDAELDRLQVGWELVPDTLVWLGRLHEPASSWNFGNDHGHYLLTAISTPAIERWADDAGALPQNITGVLVDSRRPMGTSAVEVSLAVGIAPNPIQKDHRSYWLAPINRGSHRPGWSARFALFPDNLRNSVGLLGARHRLDADDFAAAGLFDARVVDETVLGAYADTDWDRWTLHAAVYYVDLSLQATPKPRNESFAAGYAQLERRFAGRYTAFVRREVSARAQESSYLQTVQKRFAVVNSLAGLRWDFTRHQAITAEVSRTTTFSNRFTRISLQWSAVVP